MFYTIKLELRIYYNGGALHIIVDKRLVCYFIHKKECITLHSFVYSSLLAKARSNQASEMSIAKYSPFFCLFSQFAFCADCTVSTHELYGYFICNL